MKQPSEYELNKYERKPTAGIQTIAGKPFTVNYIEKFQTKLGKTMVIVETDEEFNVEYKNENGDKVTGNVNRFFASPNECQRFFGDETIMEDVNENENKIRTAIEKVPFTEEDIARKPDLKGKTHYVFVKV